MEKRYCETSQALCLSLEFTQPWSIIILDLLVQLVLAKVDNRNKAGACLKGNLAKAKALLESQIHNTWSSIKRFGSTANNNRNGSSRTRLQNGLAWLFGNVTHTQGKDVVAMQGKFKVASQRQKGWDDTRKMLRESISFGCKRGDGAHWNDAMGMITIMITWVMGILTATDLIFSPTQTLKCSYVWVRNACDTSFPSFPFLLTT